MDLDSINIMEYPPANLLGASADVSSVSSVSTCYLLLDVPWPVGNFTVLMKKVIYVHEVLHIGDNKGSTTIESYNYRNL
jgi:hypothetical protein